MGSFIEKFLGFTKKPRDGAVGGLPLQARDQIGVFVNTNQAVTVRVEALVFNPSDGTSRAVEVLAPTTTTLNNFTAEGGLSTNGLFSDGEVLCAIAFSPIGSAVGTGPNAYCSAFLFRKGVTVCQLIGDFLNGNHFPSWVAGQSPIIRGPFFAGRENAPSLFTFQGEVVNGAGGAGDQSLTVTPAAGSRVLILYGRMANLDTAARNLTWLVDDGTNIIMDFYNATATNAAAVQRIPLTGAAPAVGGTGVFNPQIWLGPGERLVGTLAAVAASENSTWAIQALVWGAAPTFTLAGASTPTLTTNTSRFETG